MGLIVRNIVLHLICAGMIVFSVTTADAFAQQAALALAAGAFALAWLTYD